MTDRRWDELPAGAGDRSDAPTAKLRPLPVASDTPRTDASRPDTPRSDANASDPAAAPREARVRRAEAGEAGAREAADRGGDATPPAGASSPSPRRAKRAPIKKPGPLPVIAASLGLFFVIVALLAFQMRAGADPAIGSGEPVAIAAASPAVARQVIVRRVVITRIVEHRPRRTPPAATTTAPASGGSAPAPSNTAPAPAPAAPAPRPQAPLTTRSS